jgi:MSHA biogenesis protein MshE
MKRIRIGDLLIEKGFITTEELDKAIAEQRKVGKKLGQVLIDQGCIQEDTLLNLLSEQLQIPYLDLDEVKIDENLAKLLPETYARRYRAVVLEDYGDALLVGLPDPFDIDALDNISRLLHRKINLAIVAESKVLAVLNGVYKHSDELSSFAEELSGELQPIDELADDFEKEFAITDAPVVKLLQSLFKDAIKSRASDIHIEPDEKVLRVRMRIDGVLHENVLDDVRIAPALVQGLKLRANLDISEKRIPQDGRFNLRLKNKHFDVRVSTMPIAFGESVVLRLLDQSTPVAELSKLGIPPEIEKQLRVITSRPHGLLLVTGPTGSGKTTTLYSLLNLLNTSERKIITVEDPVEYRIQRINQVQVNAKIDLTFARVLRAVLRQDPDIVMVGEIRDAETATIAMRAAMTGHLVLATLHTNDAMSSAMRLIDLGGKGYMVAAALKGVIAQRLARKICIHCRVPYEIEESEKAWLKEFGDFSVEQKFYRGKGCAHCHHTGYLGRLGVYELLTPDEHITKALHDNDSEAFQKAALANKFYKPLARVAMELASEGSTTIEEAIRVVGQLEG